MVKIPGSDSGRSDEIYDQVFSGIFYFYSQVFPGFPGYFRIFLGIKDIISFLEVVSQISSFFLDLLRVYLKGAGNHYARLSWCYLKYPVMCGNTRNIE